MHGNSQNATPEESAPVQPAEPQPFCLHHDFDGPAELSTTITHALSDVTGADVSEAEARLASVLDPDALDRLFGRSDDGPSASSNVGLNVWGHQIRVYDDGQIVICPPARSSSSPLA